MLSCFKKKLRKLDQLSEMYGESASYHLNGHDLLSDDGKHFNVDSIELIEASPCSAGGETFEELPHGNVVQA